jgi:hypothetical protein
MIFKRRQRPKGQAAAGKVAHQRSSTPVRLSLIIHGLGLCRAAPNLGPLSKGRIAFIKEGVVGLSAFSVAVLHLHLHLHEAGVRV